MMIKGVIFDMDGVLVDSEKFILEAAMIFLKEQGVNSKKEDFLPFVGTGEDRFIGGPAKKYGLKLDLNKAKARTYELYGQLVKGKLKPLPGVFEFIKKCRVKGLKIAVASSADRIKVLTNLVEIKLLPKTFDVIINGLEVKNKKPDPEIFLKAAEKMNLSPFFCLVVEDAVSGVAAAKAAGAKCLALTTTFPEEKLKGADWFAKNLAFAGNEVLEW